MTKVSAAGHSPVFSAAEAAVVVDGTALGDIPRFFSQESVAGSEGLRSQRRYSSVSLERSRRSVRLPRQVADSLRDVKALLMDLLSGKPPAVAWLAHKNKCNSRAAGRYLGECVSAVEHASRRRAASCGADRTDARSARHAQARQQASADSLALPKPIGFTALWSFPKEESFHGSHLVRVREDCGRAFRPHLQSLSEIQFETIRAAFAQLIEDGSLTSATEQEVGQVDACVLRAVYQLINDDAGRREESKRGELGRKASEGMDAYRVVGGRKHPDRRLAYARNLQARIDKSSDGRTIDDYVAPHVGTWDGARVLASMKNLRRDLNALTGLSGAEFGEYKRGVDGMVDAMSRECVRRPAEVFAVIADGNDVDDPFNCVGDSVWQPFFATFDTMGKAQADAFVADLTPTHSKMLQALKSTHNIGSDHLSKAIADQLDKHARESRVVIDGERELLERAVNSKDMKALESHIVSLGKAVHEYRAYRGLEQGASLEEELELGLRASLSVPDTMLRASDGMIDEKERTSFRERVEQMHEIQLRDLRQAMSTLGQYGLAFVGEVVDEVLLERERESLLDINVMRNLLEGYVSRGEWEYVKLSCGALSDAGNQIQECRKILEKPLIKDDFAAGVRASLIVAEKMESASQGVIDRETLSTAELHLLHEAIKPLSRYGLAFMEKVVARQIEQRSVEVFTEVFIENAATHDVHDEFWQPFHDTLNTMDQKQAYAFAAQLRPRQLQVLDSFKKKLGVGSEHIVSAIAAGRAKREGEIGAFIDAKRTALEHAVETGKTWAVANALTNLSRTMYEFQDYYMDLWDMRLPEAVENGLRTSLSTADMMMRTSGGVITEEAEAEFRSFLAGLSATNIDKLRVAVEALSPYGLDFMRQAVADEVVRRQQPVGAPPTYEQSIISQPG